MSKSPVRTQRISTQAEYKTVAERLYNAGYNTKTAYEAVAEAGFQVRIDNVTYTNIFVSRVIAVMWDIQKAAKADAGIEQDPLIL